MILGVRGESWSWVAVRWRRRRIWIEGDMEVGASGRLRVALRLVSMIPFGFRCPDFQIFDFLFKTFRLNTI